MIWGCTLALAQPALVATHKARFANDTVQEVQVVAENPDGTYDLIIVSTGTRLRRVAVKELQPLSTSGADIGSGTGSRNSIFLLAADVQLQHDQYEQADNPSTKATAERQLRVTLDAVLRQANGLDETNVTPRDVEAFLRVNNLVERLPWGQTLQEYDLAAQRLRNLVVNRAIRDAGNLFRSAQYEEALARLDGARPFVVGTDNEGEYDRTRGTVQIALARFLFRRGTTADNQRGLALLEDAYNSPDRRTRGRAALAAAQFYARVEDPEQTDAWITKAQDLKSALERNEQNELDLLVANLRAREPRTAEHSRATSGTGVTSRRPAQVAPAVRHVPHTAGGSYGRPAGTGGFLEQVLATIGAGEVMEYYKKQDWANFSRALGWRVGGLAGFIFFYWVVPVNYYAKRMRKQRGFEDVSRMRWVKLGGLLTVLVFYVSEFFQRTEQRLCPSCGTDLSNPKAFGDLQFEVCPFCGHKIKPLYTLEAYIEALAKTMDSVHGSDVASASVASEDQRSTMLALISSIITLATRQRASDIHLERDPLRCLARFRIDGILHESLRFPANLHNYIVTSVKTMADMDVSERRLPQDGHFHHTVDGVSVHVRVSTIPTNLGEKMVLRLLDPRQAVLATEKLGFSSEGLEQFQRALRSSSGLILTTGPTGSGKTTLLYAALSAVNDGRRSIFTIEDPIEFQLPGINQVQNNEATGLTFATALRSIMRQDPDIIMVGEIRDAETAQIAVRAAQTGHLVFSTLHTMDAAAAFGRLVDIGIDPRAVASAVLCIVAQRLVRTICPECAQDVEVTSDDLARLGLRSLPPGARVRAGAGCDNCVGSGYVGRTGIYEVLIPTRRIRELMDRNASVHEIRDAAVAAGMSTLRREAVLKVVQGITTIDEIVRVTSDLDDQHALTSTGAPPPES